MNIDARTSTSLNHRYSEENRGETKKRRWVKEHIVPNICLYIMHLFLQLPPNHWQYLFDFDNSIHEVLVLSSQTFACGDTMTSHDFENAIPPSVKIVYFIDIHIHFFTFFPQGFTCQLVCLFFASLQNIRGFSALSISSTASLASGKTDYIMRNRFIKWKTKVIKSFLMTFFWKV